jgi:hypothetical protein
MGAAAEPIVETVEHLDFSPTCTSRVCEQTATVVVRSRCTRCGKPVAWPVCVAHIAVAVDSITRTIWTHGAENPHGCPYIIELEFVAVEPLR